MVNVIHDGKVSQRSTEGDRRSRGEKIKETSAVKHIDVKDVF